MRVIQAKLSVHYYRLHAQILWLYTYWKNLNRFIHKKYCIHFYVLYLSSWNHVRKTGHCKFHMMCTARCMIMPCQLWCGSSHWCTLLHCFNPNQTNTFRHSSAMCQAMFPPKEAGLCAKNSVGGVQLSRVQKSTAYFGLPAHL